MEKIKYLLGIGILGTLFSSCFGFSARYGSFNVFHSVNSELGNSSALLMKYYNMASFRINPSNYYSLNGTNNWGSSVGRMLYVKASGLPDSAPLFDFSFYSPKGLSIALNSGIFFNLTESSYTFFGSRSFNPTNGDTYPLIFSDSQDYLTFNNETTLAYNGQTYNYGNQGILKYCFYGVNYDLSCVFYSSDSYNLVNFSYNSGTDSIFISSGYLIVPLHTITESACYSAYGGNATCGRFDGTSSLILKDVDDVVYRNIVNCYGSNYIIDNSCTVLSKGYINGLTSSQFFQRSFLTLAGGGTIQNGLGYFSEIFHDSSKFYYRSNSVYTSFTEGSPYTSMGYFSPYSELDLQNSDSAPVILDLINNGGGGNNSSFPDPIINGGVFDANTYLIEESIKCYITSGEVCNSPFTLEGSTNYVDSYSHGPRYRDSESHSGTLTFNNAYDMLAQYCLNTSTIQYSFCSQLSLYNGYPITYYYNNGYFNYYIFGSGFTYNLGVMRSGQLGYAYCEGPNCSDINEGLPQYIKKDTGDYSAYGFSGEYVTLDFFKNYFENGFFFQCPFSYSGSYFTIGSKLIDRLDSHDPLKPINCFISAFSHGVKSSFFGDSNLGLLHSGSFLELTGPYATRFYTFIDIVLCLGYIFLFSKLFKFLKKH